MAHLPVSYWCPVRSESHQTDTEMLGFLQPNGQMFGFGSGYHSPDRGLTSHVPGGSTSPGD